MKMNAIVRNSFPSQIAIFVLASAVGIPAWAQQTQPAGDSSQSAQTSNTPPQNYTPAAPYVAPAREGFWGRVNPFARKKWVKKQTDPINDRLSELDEVNAKNAKDIQDVDTRAQAGIRQAQSTADTANQAATAAGSQAQNANTVAQGATGHVDQLHTTVNGLDQYHPISEVDVPFHGSQGVLSATANKQLDDLVTNVNGHKGYIVEMEAHSPSHGSVGIQNSERMAASVKRYLVEHDIPVYRVHAVALGNARPANDADDNAKPIRTASVHIRLMENSLAARDAASPKGTASSSGAERP